MIRRALALIAAAVLLTAADDPKDYLKDPAQEARARELFSEIRCVVCQNETIAASEADVAHQVRMLVREQIAEGKTDAQIKDHLVDRWGEFILVRPRFNPRNAALWTLPFLIVLGGLGGIFLRRRRPGIASVDAAESELSMAELKALKQLQNNSGDTHVQ